jgi:5-methylcytosine-specific restriction endonuclease McrA
MNTKTRSVTWLADRMSDTREHMRVYVLDRYHRRRAQAIEALGGVCARCGFDDTLEFDHIDPSTKEFRLARGLAGYSETRIQAELAKCQLLCKECHYQKSREDRQCLREGK